MRLVLSRDAGRTFDEPRVVDAGAPPIGRADVTILDDDSVVVLWLARASGPGAELRVRRYPASGRPDAPLTVTDVGASRSAGFPRIASFGDRALVAWTEAGPRVGMALLILSPRNSR